MFYMICATDKPDTLAERLAARPAHLARLNELKDQGRLLIAGPFPAIDSDADADPYIDAGVYKEVVVKPYKKGLP